MSNYPIKYLTKESESVEAAMKSGDNVKVFPKERRVLWWRKVTQFYGFEPIGENNKPKGVGLIYYPGAKVTPEQYSHIARSLAELGYHVAIVDFAFDFGVTNYKRAEDVFNYRPWKDTVKSWAIAGHSLGGAMACGFANDMAPTREQLKGIVLHASYPGDNKLFFYGNLKGLGLKVCSIWSKLDGLTTKEEIENTKQFLPDNTKFIAIEGGNHTQYYYSDQLQDKDNEAKISLNDQQLIIREETHKLLLEISE